ncbi:hypothetical protein OT109_14040 [Phycisphaeraceae bacterium D3-23]
MLPAPSGAEGAIEIKAALHLGEGRRRIDRDARADLGDDRRQRDVLGPHDLGQTYRCLPGRRQLGIDIEHHAGLKPEIDAVVHQQRPGDHDILRITADESHIRRQAEVFECCPGIRDRPDRRRSRAGAHQLQVLKMRAPGDDPPGHHINHIGREWAAV